MPFSRLARVHLEERRLCQTPMLRSVNKVLIRGARTAEILQKADIRLAVSDGSNSVHLDVCKCMRLCGNGRRLIGRGAISRKSCKA